MGLTAALATAGRALEVFSAGLQISGQNIANANTPDYVREKLVLQSNTPYLKGNLIFGTGVLAHGIRQQIDKYLETRIHSANGDSAGSAARTSIFQQLETTLQELGTSDLSTSLNEFLGKINDVVNQPEIAANLDLAIQEGVQFAQDIVALRSRIDSLRTAQSVKVNDLVEEANRLIEEIHRLNPQIVAAEAAGLGTSDAGGLRSQRYGALNRLAEILPIEMREMPNGSVEVFMGSDYLLLGTESQKLETVTSVDRGVQIVHVRLASSKAPLSGSRGELNGILLGRDETLTGFVDQLDQFTSNLIYEFNKIHASGEGRAGFTNVTGTYAAADITLPLNAAGLPFTPTHGSFQVKITNKATGLTETVTIDVDLDGIGADTSLDDLRGALDGIANISASLSADRRLTLSASAGYEIRFANDTSGTLAALGINTFFTGTSSQDIGVNSAILGNSGLFAAGRGGGSADSSNAVLLAQFSDRPIAGLNNLSVNEYYEGIVSRLAQQSATESAISSGYSAFRDALLNQRAQYSGVSIDEEALQMMDFQRSYQAAARMISTVDELYKVLLNI